VISVIVPIYKTEKYLKRCIESIINQTYTDMEILLVNDGSPDNCGSICDEYSEKDDRIKVIHKENGGVSSARNVGLDMAEGEYISFVDSDDFIKSNMIEVLMSNMLSTQSDLVICNYENLYENNRVKIRSDYENRVFESIYEFEKLFVYYYYKAGIIDGPCNKLYKSVMCGRFDEKLHNGEDGFFILEYLKKCNRISVINNVLYTYQHINPESATMKYKDNYFEICELILSITEDFCIENFSSSFDVKELYFAFCMEIDAAFKYYIYRKMPYKKLLLKVREGMQNAKFMDIIEKIEYKQMRTKEKLKYFAVKVLIKNKLSGLLIGYGKLTFAVMLAREKLA